VTSSVRVVRIHLQCWDQHFERLRRGGPLCATVVGVEHVPFVRPHGPRACPGVSEAVLPPERVTW
jgi:hypothetical protein